MILQLQEHYFRVSQKKSKVNFYKHQSHRMKSKDEVKQMQATHSKGVMV